MHPNAHHVHVQFGPTTTDISHTNMPKFSAEKIILEAEIVFCVKEYYIFRGRHIIMLKM